MKPPSIKGFTLIELVVVVAIFSVLFAVVSNTFINSLKAASKAEATKEVRQNAEVILARMSYDIKQAQQDTIGCPSGTSIAFVDGSGPVPEPVMYFVSTTGPANQLMRQRGTEEDRITDPRSVQFVPGSVSFTCDAPTGMVNISFILEYIPFGNVDALTNVQSQDAVRIPFRTSAVNRNVD